MPLILAVDPGSNEGAAVLLESAEIGGPRIRGVFAWKRGPARRPGLVFRGAFVPSDAGSGRIDRLIGQSRIESGHQLGLCIEIALRGSGFTSLRLVVEDVFVGRNAATAIGLARWSGAFAGALESVAPAGAEYVRADEWRAQAFGIRRATKREVAKAATAAALPVPVHARLSDFGPAVGGVSHLIDAAGIGLWASGLRVEAKPTASRRRGRK